MRKSNPELHERRRTEILIAAERCFTERGFHASSMGEIAAAADISPGLLYRYFENKNALVLASAARERAAAIAALEALIDVPDVIDRLIELVKLELQQSLDPARARLSSEILAEAARNAALATHLIAEESAVRSCFVRVLKGHQRTGRIASALDPGAFADLLFALLDGLPMRAQLSTDFKPRVTAQLLERMLRSVLAP